MSTSEVSKKKKTALHNNYLAPEFDDDVSILSGGGTGVDNKRSLAG